MDWLGRITNSFTATIQSKLLLVMSVVALVPLLLFGSLFYFQARTSLIQQVGERLQASSHLAMSQIDRSFGFAFENIRSWSELEILQEVEYGDPDGLVSDMLQDYQRSYGVYSNLVVADVTGRVVAAGDRDLVGVSVKEAPWFVHTLNTRTSRVGDLRLDPYVGGYGVAITVPVFGKGEERRLIGVLNASFSWTELLQMTNAIEVVNEGQTQLGYALMVDREGYIIAAPGFILLDDEGSTNEGDVLRVYGKRWPPLTDASLLREVLQESGHRYLTLDEQSVLAVNAPGVQYQHLKPMGWSLLLVRDAEDALSDMSAIREKAVLVAVVTAGMIFIFAYFAARQIARPVLMLTHWANDLARGRLGSRIELRTRDEIGELANSLDNMRRDLKGYLDEIYDAKERFQSLINSIDCIVWEAEVAPLRMVWVNGQTEHVLGHSADDLLEVMADWDAWIHPDHQERIREVFRHAVDEAQDGVVEFKARHQDGHWVWLKGLISVELEGLHVVGLRGVMVDINDIVNASEEMAHARDIAIRTAESKSRFLAIVSHEIRTPMNGMLGMLELMADSELNEEQQQQLDIARRSGKNLVALVDDVMDFTRLESGDMRFAQERADLHQLLHDMISLIAPDAYRKGLDIGVVQEINLPKYVCTDAVKLRQALSSLLSNALKFTSHGSILLWAELLPDDRLYIEVKDTGVGIAGEDQEDIFKPFVQVDVSTTRRFEGSGLGLALSQRFIEAMGGSIGVKSIKGVGSSFFIELPVQVADARESDTLKQRQAFFDHYSGAAVLLIGDLPATKMVLQIACQQWGLSFHWEPKESRLLRQWDEVFAREDYRWVFIAQEMSDRFWSRLNPWLAENQKAQVIQLRLPHEKAGQRPFPHIYVPLQPQALITAMVGERWKGLEEQGQTATSQPEQPTILVVDDNPVNRKVASGFLAKLGYPSDVAEHGAEALDKVREHTYGAVLMDCQMPVMDGYEATRAIRQYLKGRYLPIIAVTANAMDGDKEKCLAAGMDDYIAKPLRKNVLEKTLFDWLNRAEVSAR